MNTPLTQHQQVAIANVLEDTLTNAGWFDDADELLVDMLGEETPKNEVAEYALDVDTSIRFINSVLGKNLPANTSQTLKNMLNILQPEVLRCQDCLAVNTSVKKMMCPYDDDVLNKQTEIQVCELCCAERAAGT